MKTAICSAHVLYAPLFTQRQRCENAAIGTKHGLPLCGKHIAEAKRTPGILNVWRWHAKKAS